jgi:cyclin-dependent kinase
MVSPNHGTQIGRYVNANHWKDGISSDIYQAKDPEDGSVVALKVTTPAMMSAPHDSVREARILQNNQLPKQSKKAILHDLFTGLAHLHSQEIIHRDIKPSNILLPTLRGPAYIADLGTAWSATDSASEPPTTKHLEVGTTSYRPPELLFGKQDYGTKLDMWAAGCVAAQVLGLGNQTLFDSGDLGSELALIKSIFETLGTPNLEVWPVCCASAVLM